MDRYRRGMQADLEKGGAVMTTKPKPNPNVQILDHYGNNEAVRCPACNGVFIVSSHINKNGRECPHCHGATMRVEKNGSAREIM